MKTFILILSLTLTSFAVAESTPMDNTDPHTAATATPKKKETHHHQREAKRTPAESVTQEQREAGPDGRLR